MYYKSDVVCITASVQSYCTACPFVLRSVLCKITFIQQSLRKLYFPVKSPSTEGISQISSNEFSFPGSLNHPVQSMMAVLIHYNGLWISGGI